MDFIPTELRKNRKLKKIFKDHKVNLAYLFGSQLTRYKSQDSDSDIAVLFDRQIGKNDYFEKKLELVNQLTRFFHKDTDIIVLNKSPILLKYVATSEGQVIYEQNESDHSFYEVKVMNEYFDFAPFLELYYKKNVETFFAQNLGKA